MRNVLLSGFLALALAAGSVLGAEIKIDFGETATDQTPTNFQSVLAGTGQPGIWAIVSDATPPMLAPLSAKAPAVSTRPVLAQTSRDPADERFPMLVYAGGTFSDFNLTTHFKIVSGLTEQMAGVVFRFLNTSNFYVVRASALGRNLRFYKVVNGVRSAPIGPQLDIPTGVWHTLSVQTAGNQITLWLDQKLVMPPLNDNTFTDGKIGFWTKSDAVSYFSDLTIDYTPRVPAAQTLVDSVVKSQSRLLGLRIYALNPQGQPRILASKNPEETGRPGGDAEKAAITDGRVSFGSCPGTVAVWLPFRDRNGDPMAAVWVQLKSFWGETQDTAITRATMILKLMQAQITSSEALLK